MTIALLAKVKSALDKLGKNGTAPEQPDIPKDIRKSNTDTDKYVSDYNLVHEYCIADYMASYAKKRREQTLKKIKETFGSRAVAIPGASANVTLGNYSLIVSVKNPAKQLDPSLLADNLRKKGWTQTDIDALIEGSKKENKAPETWSVSSNVE